jgi:hypothetical protein
MLDVRGLAFGDNDILDYPNLGAHRVIPQGMCSKKYGQFLRSCRLIFGPGQSQASEDCTAKLEIRRAEMTIVEW